MSRYFPEPEPDSPDVPDVIAALDEGIIVSWRVGIDGTQWYRTLPEIHGVPDQPDPLDDLDCLLDGDDDGDDEIEWVDGDDDDA